MNIEFRVDESATGRRNMELDLELHASVHTGRCDVGLRLYSWDPWCVSLGKHQSTDGLNAEALSRYELDVVHRPTGGRAVLHANEVTYCLCVSMPDTTKSQVVYAAVHDLLYAVLSPVAPALSHASLSTDLRMHYSAQQPLGQACFTSHAKSEILWGQRKVVGSAQRVMDGVLLQHGSILCGPEHEILAHIIAPNPESLSGVEQALKRSSASLSEAAGAEVTIDNLMQLFSDKQHAISEQLQSICQLAVDARS
ncbi:MAG: biotin/lipoate A/B protein ligase family protein [Ignavibacteria bacterium]|jgi:lipoate-protein ligase A